MRVKIDLDTETADRLIKAAVAERRPIDWQAGVLLRRALGLPFPREGNAQLASDAMPAGAAGNG
jgi:hypothetical protein